MTPLEALDEIDKRLARLTGTRDEHNALRDKVTLIRDVLLRAAIADNKEKE